ncbi:hypothetical protein Taro_021571, partial [Colocasia esculenta]|nr:hypothetical protein [Colocasia esculenta]
LCGLFLSSLSLRLLLFLPSLSSPLPLSSFSLFLLFPPIPNPNQILLQNPASPPPPTSIFGIFSSFQQDPDQLAAGYQLAQGACPLGLDYLRPTKLRSLEVDLEGGRPGARSARWGEWEGAGTRRRATAAARMTPPNLTGQFGDTTYTKVFVGGLAWETQTETMRKYFEQFGEILEAVVITDKNTGRSKGYGFVTFREPEAAMRACVDASPVIDGRRANCNLASLGVQRSKPTTPQHAGVRNLRVMKSFHTGHQGGAGTTFPSAATFPYYAIQQGIPYNLYGYSPYSPDYTYPTSYYNPYGSAAAQYPIYGGTTGVVTGTTPFFPYFQFGQGGGGASTYAQGQGYGVQYPHMFQYSTVTSAAAGVTSYGQHYGGPISLAASPPAQAGMTMALTSPSLPNPTPHHYRLIPTQFIPSTASEQPLA